MLLIICEISVLFRNIVSGCVKLKWLSRFFIMFSWVKWFSFRKIVVNVISSV